MKTFNGHVKQALKTHIEQNGLITSPDLLIERIGQAVRHWLEDEQQLYKRDRLFRGDLNMHDVKAVLETLREGTQE